MSPRETPSLAVLSTHKLDDEIISAYATQHAVVGVSIDPFGIDFSKQRIRRVVNETLRRMLPYVISLSMSSRAAVVQF